MSTLADFFNNLTSTGLTALSQMSPATISAAVSGLTGPSQNAQSIGALLDELPSLYASGDAADIRATRLQIVPLQTGLSTNVKNALATVWSVVATPGQPGEVAAAIRDAKNALGV